MYSWFAWRKFSPFLPSALMGKLYPSNSLSCVNDYLNPMVTLPHGQNLFQLYFCKAANSLLYSLHTERMCSTVHIAVMHTGYVQKGHYYYDAKPGVDSFGICYNWPSSQLCDSLLWALKWHTILTF